MALLDLDDAEQPIDPKLAFAIEAAFRRVTTTQVEFVPVPRIWAKAVPGRSNGGPSGARKANIKMQLGKRDGFQCAYCAREFLDLDDATLDHVIPNSIVRHWAPWNLLLACEPCNTLKADRVPLVLMPLLCSLLQTSAQTGVARAAERKLSAKSHRRQKWQTSRRRKQNKRFYAAMAALTGAPTRRAIEAPRTRLALMPGEGGQR